MADSISDFLMDLSKEENEAMREQWRDPERRDQLMAGYGLSPGKQQILSRALENGNLVPVDRAIDREKDTANTTYIWIRVY